MLTSRPLTDSFALAWKHDPALASDLPDFAEQYQRAIETLDFAPLTREGQRPTLFHLKALRGVALEALRASAKGELGPTEAITAFRASLVRLEHADGLPELTWTTDHERRDLGRLVSVEWMAMLDAIGTEFGHPFNSIALQLGMAVLQRSITPSPK
jgi:hypothetical protein